MADENTGQYKGPTLTHSQSINRLKEVTTEIERLAELDELSPEDQTYFDELRTEFTTVDKHRKYLERQLQLAQIKSAAEGAHASNLRLERGAYVAPAGTTGGDYDRDAILEPDSIEDHRFKDPWNLADVRAFGRSKEEVNAELTARALAAIEKMPAATDKIREAGTSILERFDDSDATIAKTVLAASSPAYLRAWSKMATNRAHTLTADESRALDAVRAMSLTDSAGGYLVPFQLDPTVIVTSAGSRNDIRSVARQVVATGDVWNGVSSGAVSWSWDAEGAEVSDDATTFAQPTVPVYKAAGFVPISIEAMEDASNVTQEVGRLLAEGRMDLESVAFITGTGSGQPTGIVTALAGTSSEINAATDDVFALADVYTIQGAVPAKHRANASWLANNLIYNRIRQFDTSGGGGFWDNLNADRPPNLLGRPALEAEAMDGTITTSGAVSNYALIFGNFQNYVIADRIGMTVEFIPHLFHTTTNRPSGQRGWYAYYRVGADSVNDGAFRMLDVASAA